MREGVRVRERNNSMKIFPDPRGRYGCKREQLQLIKTDYHASITFSVEYNLRH